MSRRRRRRRRRRVRTQEAYSIPPSSESEWFKNHQEPTRPTQPENGVEGGKRKKPEEGIKSAKWTPSSCVPDGNCNVGVLAKVRRIAMRRTIYLEIISVWNFLVVLVALKRRLRRDPK